MSRASNRERILACGLQVMHEHGYAGASVRDIVQAAGVPQGSFTNHFASKEAFGLEVIDLYLDSSRDLIDATLRNEALPPLERLRRYIEESTGRLACNEMRDGCLLGNLAAEASRDSEPIRERLVLTFGLMEGWIADCLRAAVAAGEVPADLDPVETAAYIITSLQGANLMAKTVRNQQPVERFKKALFEKVLR